MILELVFDSRRSPRPSHEHAELSADLTATLIESLTLGPWGLYGGEPVVCWALGQRPRRLAARPGQAPDPGEPPPGPGSMEVRSSYRLRTLARAPAKRTQQERENQLRELAVAAGVPASDVKKTLRSPRYHDIVREAGDQMVLGADITEFIWSGCSSLAHGDLSGTLGLLNKEIVARDKDVAYTRVTGSISGLYWSTVGAALMIEHGFNLYLDRAARHY
jgi:hypothetical protein